MPPGCLWLVGERGTREAFCRWLRAFAIGVCDLRSPLRRPLRAGDRTALTAAGTQTTRTGDLVVFLKPVAVASALVRRDGRVQAGGHPAGHAGLGVIEQQLDAMTGSPARSTR